MTKQAFSAWQCFRAWLKTPLTTHGHGIHSPFLYRLVTEVLDSRYDFYQMEALEHSFPYATEGQLSAVWVLYRLAVYYSISEIRVGDGVSPSVEKMAHFIQTHPAKGVAGPLLPHIPSRIAVEKAGADVCVDENTILMLTDSTLRKACHVALKGGCRTIIHMAPVSLLFGSSFLPMKLYSISLS